MVLTPLCQAMKTRLIFRKKIMLNRFLKFNTADLFLMITFGCLMIRILKHLKPLRAPVVYGTLIQRVLAYWVKMLLVVIWVISFLPKIWLTSLNQGTLACSQVFIE